LIRAIIDTHALIWYVFGDSRMTATARAEIDGAAATGDQVGISSISLVEIVYLTEKGRIDPTTLDQVRALLDSEALFVEVVVDRPVVLAMRGVSRAMVPDMPDRIIAATALHLGVPLISRDGKIRTSGVATIW
jgi:PIN domain nuclease of toxin-antitoxin system